MVSEKFLLFGPLCGSKLNLAIVIPPNYLGGMGWGGVGGWGGEVPLSSPSESTPVAVRLTQTQRHGAAKPPLHASSSFTSHLDSSSLSSHVVHSYTLPTLFYNLLSAP